MKKIINIIKGKLRSLLVKSKKFLAWKTADCYFISFPKSGRTWIRMFLSKYFSLHFSIPFDDEFYNVLRPAHKIPKLVFSHGGYKGQIIKKKGRGYSFDKKIGEENVRELKGKNILFLVRDPRDVVVSHYFALTKRAKLNDIKDYNLSDFIRDERFGIKNIIDYMNFWYESRDMFGKFMLVRYENCKQDQDAQFKNVLNFIGIDKIDDSTFKKALDYSSFDNMKKIEKSGEMSTGRMKPGDPKDKESYKVRKGKVGGFVDYMNEKDVEYVNKQMKYLKKELKY